MLAQDVSGSASGFNLWRCILQDLLPRKPGIYKIVNTITGKMYVGSSKNVYRRCYEHRRSLLKNKHHSKYLQRSWNSHGEQYFKFILIEECDESFLIDREQYFIDSLKPEYNMNPLAGSCAGRIVSEDELKSMSERAKLQWQQPGFREKYSEIRSELMKDPDILQRMSDSAKRRYVENPEHAEQHSQLMKNLWGTEEHKVKMSLARNNYHQNPEFKELQSKVKLEICSTPEYRESRQKLTNEQAIWALYQKKLFGHSRSEIAFALNVSDSLIKDLLQGRTYTQIDRNTFEIDWSLLKIGKNRRG